MPSTKQSRFENKILRQRREAQRNERFRESRNDSPRVDLFGYEWNSRAIPPPRARPRPFDPTDLERMMSARVTRIMIEFHTGKEGEHDA